MLQNGIRVRLDTISAGLTFDVLLLVALAMCCLIALFALERHLFNRHPAGTWDFVQAMVPGSNAHVPKDARSLNTRILTITAGIGSLLIASIYESLVLQRCAGAFYQ